MNDDERALLTALMRRAPGAVAPPTLAEALEELRPAWMGEAACRGAPTSMFFKVRVNPTEARRICAGCPVSVECLAYANEHDLEGVWGGLDKRQRRHAATASRQRADARLIVRARSA